VSLWTSLIALAAAAVAAATATPAAAQVPGPSVNLATDVEFRLGGGLLQPDGRVPLRIRFVLDRPERCEPGPLTQIIFRDSGPRRVGFTTVEQVARFTSPTRPYAAGTFGDQLDPAMKYQYRVVAFCGDRFTGEFVQGPAFSIDFSRDRFSTASGPLPAYLGTWSLIGGPYIGGVTFEANEFGDFAELTTNFLAAAWVTTRDLRPSSDTDQASVACDGRLCAVTPTSLDETQFSQTRPQQVMIVNRFREFDSESVARFHKLRIIANDHDGVDLDAFLMVVECPRTC
jgi:hypothetical protein